MKMILLFGLFGLSIFLVGCQSAPKGEAQYEEASAPAFVNPSNDASEVSGKMIAPLTSAM